MENDIGKCYGENGYWYCQKNFQKTRRKNYLVVNRAKTTTFGEKSQRTFAPKIWNSLPEGFEDLTSL